MNAAMPITRTCQLGGCDEALVRRPTEGAREFAERRFCCKEHAAASRRKPEVPGARRKTAGNLAAAPPYAPRITPAGIWRPNAPGWPDEPGART